MSRSFCEDLWIFKQKKIMQKPFEHNPQLISSANWAKTKWRHVDEIEIYIIDTSPEWELGIQMFQFSLSIN